MSSQRHKSYSDILSSPTIYHATLFVILGSPCIFLLWLFSGTQQTALPFKQLSTQNLNVFVTFQLLLYGNRHLYHSCVFYPYYRRLEVGDWIFIFMTLALNIQFTFAPFHFATILAILTELSSFSSFSPGYYVFKGHEYLSFDIV